MKRFLLCICPLLAAAAVLGLVCQLTAEAAPAVLISDDFEDGDADGWTEQAGDWAVISQTNVAYRVVYTGTGDRSRRLYYDPVTATTWSDYYIEAKMMVETPIDDGDWGMLMARWQTERYYYYMVLQGDGRIRIRKYVNASSTTMATVDPDLSRDTWYTLGLDVTGTTTVTLRAFLDGTPILTATDDPFDLVPGDLYLTGTCALGSFDGSAKFDDVVVQDYSRTTTYVDENFEDYVADDWTVQSGYWEMVDYPYNYVYYAQSGGPSTGRSYVDSPVDTDCAIQARVYVSDGQYAMLLARYHDSDNYYFMTLRPSTGKVEVRRYLNGSSSGGTLGSVDLGIVTGQWYAAAFELSGSTLRAYVDGTPVITASDSTFVTGTVGLPRYQANVYFDDFILTDIRALTLTASTEGSGSGLVTSDPAGIDCGTTCTAGFQSGTVVTLTATPTGTHTFAGWMGACTGTGDCVVTMDEAKSVVAVFGTPTDPMLLAYKTGNGDGSVASDPAGLDCGATCAVSFTQNTVVTLTATPGGFSTLTGWSADCSGTATTCVVTMTTDANVTADFIRDMVLTVIKDGNGNGTVASDPAGIDCGATCSEGFTEGTVVTLTATPAGDSVFDGWTGGGCSGTGTCVVTMDNDVDVNATFTLLTYTLTVNRAGNGMGSTLSDPAGINNCSNITCTAIFDINTVVTMTASPNPACSFDGWSGEGCSGTGTCMLTIDGDKEISATYATYAVFLPLVQRGGGTGEPTPPDFGMTGYATLSALGRNGTDGGAGGAVRTVTNLADLRLYAEDEDTPYIVQISGTISTTETGNDARVRVASDKTIVGLGSTAELDGVWLSIDAGVSDVIIRNLKISRPVAPADAIHIQGPGTHHIWIDHCDLSADTDHDKDYRDGLLDITHEVDYVTISWTRFHDHFKGSLVGHSDSNAAEDTGHFLITCHHNYFYNVNSRMPSNRFGTVHSYNNYVDNSNESPAFDANSGISSRMGACTRIENNYFVGLGEAVMTDQSSSMLGEVQLFGNIFVDCTAYATAPTCVLAPPCSFTVDSAVAVPGIVSNYSGVGMVTDALVW